MYKVVFEKSAEKNFEKINPIHTVSIASRIKKLSENPRPEGCKKLSGSKNTYRIRVGVYRIIYTIEDNILTVNVVQIGHRKDVYR